MNILSAVLTLAAILFALLTIGFFVVWVRGINSLLFPGLGLIVGTPLVVALLLIVTIVTGFLAWLTNRGS